LRTKLFPTWAIFFAVVSICFILLSALTTDVQLKVQYIGNMLLLAVTISDKIQTMTKKSKKVRKVVVKKLILN